MRAALGDKWGGSPAASHHEEVDEQLEKGKVSRSQDLQISGRLLLLARAVALVTVSALGLLFTSAGVLVQDGTSLDVHRSAAIALHVLTGVLALVLGWRAWATRRGRWAAVVALVLFGATFAQASLGGSSTLAFHIGVALVLTVLCTWLAAWTFGRSLYEEIE